MKRAAVASCWKLEGQRGRVGGSERFGRHLGVLYEELQPQLERIVGANLHAPRWLIEEACQTAWGKLLKSHAHVPPGSELGWLSTTATRCALRLMRQEAANSPPRAGVEHRELDCAPCEPELQTDAGLRFSELMLELRRLPERQARVVLMSGLGYGREEIAAATGLSLRTVRRQLPRARERLKEAVAL